MGSYQQFGNFFSYGAGPQQGSAVVRILLAAGFIGAICLITIVIGAASVQYP